MASRKAKVEFSDEEKEELLKAFEGGMNSVSKDRLPKIQELARALQKEENEIKNWIGNERSRRKRSAPSEAPPAKKPPQKLRAPNCYNLFTREFFQSAEGTAISDLGEKNRAASVKWKALNQDERGKYEQLAAQIPTESSAPGPSTYHDKWHETQRVLSNLQGNCDWAEKFGVRVMYIVCNDKNHYVGGSQSGREYLESNPHIPTSFLISTKPGVTPVPPEPSNSRELRVLVQQQLNAKYSLAVGDSQARVPYKALKPQHVIGLPPGISLTHPSNLSQSNLEAVYNSLSSIKFVGVPPKPLYTETEHSYCRGSSNTRVRQSSTQGYTTLSKKGAEDDVALNVPKDSETTSNCIFGATVQLLSESYAPVGTGVTMNGSRVHCHDIPDGFIRVTVSKINPGTKPLVRGTDEDLAKGCITAWPLKLTRKT